MKAHYKRYVLNFESPGRTSRGVLTEKETWFLYLTDGKKKGIGECSLFRGLSADDRPDYEDQLKDLCDLINQKKVYPLLLLSLSHRFRWVTKWPCCHYNPKIPL